MSKIIVTGLILAVLLGSVAVFVLYKADQARSELPVLGTVGEFALTNQYGETFTEKDMLGKLNVVNFFFTSCRGPCPTMNGHFADLYRMYDGSERVQLVGFSVDPAVDTVEKLQEYAADFGVDDDRWMFLRGPIDTVAHICENYFMLPADDLPGYHSTKFALVDQQNRIRGYYSGTDAASIEVLKTHLVEMLEDLK